MRRVATYTALALGAAMTTLGIAQIAAALLGFAVDPHPEIATGGVALMLATGLIGGNGSGRDGNARADTRRGRRR